MGPKPALERIPRTENKLRNGARKQPPVSRAAQNRSGGSTNQNDIPTDIGQWWAQCHRTELENRNVFASLPGVDADDAKLLAKLDALEADEDADKSESNP